MTEQPEALRLADALTEKEYPPRRAAADELRRLHSMNAQLLEALGNLEEYSKRVGNVVSNLAAAVAAEREACAKVAEAYEPRCDTCPSGVANAIRARG